MLYELNNLRLSLISMHF